MLNILKSAFMVVVLFLSPSLASDVRIEMLTLQINIYKMIDTNDGRPQYRYVGPMADYQIAPFEEEAVFHLENVPGGTWIDELQSVIDGRSPWLNRSLVMSGQIYSFAAYMLILNEKACYEADSSPQFIFHGVVRASGPDKGKLNRKATRVFVRLMNEVKPGFGDYVLAGIMQNPQDYTFKVSKTVLQTNFPHKACSSG